VALVKQHSHQNHCCGVGEVAAPGLTG